MSLLLLFTGDGGPIVTPPAAADALELRFERVRASHLGSEEGRPSRLQYSRTFRSLLDDEEVIH
jgi:hypothetical protein